MSATLFTVENRPRIPPELARIGELAEDLRYTWDRQLRQLFRLLDDDLYTRTGANPKVFLRRVDQRRLEAATRDAVFMEAFRRVLAALDGYRDMPTAETIDGAFDRDGDQVAYFCFEFGLHETLPLYSGGLGILAGDHLKAAATLGLPFVAVGLLYRQGYFEQRIDDHGRQLARYSNTAFEDLPLAIARDGAGAEHRVHVEIADRDIALRLWAGRAGRARLVLLDADLEENAPEDRALTHRLYGGDTGMRIAQEIALGIGGVRALRALGFAPTVWHMNEGHSAFQFHERCREAHATGIPLEAAIEAVAASTVFTTHTPVPAGHDRFDPETVEHFLGRYLDAFGERRDRMLALGLEPDGAVFNMTTLGMRGARHHNGVSRIHGDVAARNDRELWPEIPPEENPVEHVTNGVHLQTFMALEWTNFLDTRFPEWRTRTSEPAFWNCIDEIPDHRFWSIRHELKLRLLEDVRRRLETQHRRAGTAQATLDRIVAQLRRPDRRLLVLGFARRFATYKRALLMLSDPERLARILGDPDRPVVLVVAGKAHPNDEPGQEILRRVHALAQDPAFVGHLLLVENYDLAMARRLVAGVDVWINTPEYPMEACGTSGMKVAVNGGVNLSMLDGWWAEAFDGTNGWAIRPHDMSRGPEYCTEQEARDLLELLEHQVVPLYFDDPDGAGWARMARNSMKTVIPRFNAEHMVCRYVERFYVPAARQGRRLAAEHGAPAAELAAWKRRVAEAWPAVKLTRATEPVPHLHQGEPLELAVTLALGGLSPEDVRVECVLGDPDAGNGVAHRFRCTSGPDADGVARFALSLVPPEPGLLRFRVRAFPWHPLLSHPFEAGRMRWL
jgi:starch phosphorylase